MASPIQVGDRWAIIGATGSGKTVLSRALLKFYYRAVGGRVPIIIFDTKIADDFKEFEKRKDLTQIIKGNDPEKVLGVAWKKPFTIWQPEKDIREMYDAYFAGIYYSARKKRTASITYIDELSAICNKLGDAPTHYDVLQKTGRGTHNGIISVTQSPSYVPSNLIRQATHMIRMQINDDYDLKKIVKSMGKESLEPPMDDYGFWYRNCTKPVRKQPAIYYPDYKNFIGE